MHVRAPWPATITLIAGALITSGCSTKQDARATEGSPRGTASSNVASRHLTMAQLKTLTFKEGEVPQASKGGIAVQEPEPKSEQPSFPPVSVPACQTMLDIRSGEHASAVAVQVFNWKGDIWPGGSTLAAYEDGKARQAFVQLKQALGSCHSYTGEGWVGKFKATVKMEQAPQIGDEAVRFREIIPMGPDMPGDRNEQITVVRTGNTIVTFTMLNVGGSSSFPLDLINKQVGRLRNAQRP